MEETQNTSGFYKFQNDEWFYGPNKVINLNYELHRELKDTYTYPIDGWNWYDTEPTEYTEWLRIIYDNI